MSAKVEHRIVIFLKGLLGIVLHRLTAQTALKSGKASNGIDSRSEKTGQHSEGGICRCRIYGLRCQLAIAVASAISETNGIAELRTKDVRFLDGTALAANDELILHLV